jgi:hypothetical protein
MRATGRCLCRAVSFVADNEEFLASLKKSDAIQLKAGQ